MNRTAINPSTWGLNFSMNQGEVTEGLTRYLHCSGQVALVEDADAEMGISVAHVGDIRGQMEAAFANVDAVLEQAGMSRSNILKLQFFTTDMDGFLENYDVYASWIGEAGITPPQTLLGISRLAVPDLLVEVDATAGA